MEKRKFEEWLDRFRASISGYQYYVDFAKVAELAGRRKRELELLNCLVGSDAIEEDFAALVSRHPEVLRCIPTLLAVRQEKLYAQDEEGAFWYDFEHPNYPVEQYKVLMRKTGLFSLLQHNIISNLSDFMIGVETGLDSNARKNRGGHLMEDLVEEYMKKSGVKEYYKEMYLSEVESTWNLDLSALSNNGKTRKRFDFVVHANGMVYGIETNFYGGTGGSKLNETARSYKMLATEAAAVHGFEFVWFTDGTGWIGSRENLRETFDAMEHIYNIDDMEHGIMKQLFCSL